MQDDFWDDDRIDTGPLVEKIQDLLIGIEKISDQFDIKFNATMQTVIKDAVTDHIDNLWFDFSLSPTPTIKFGTIEGVTLERQISLFDVIFSSINYDKKALKKAIKDFEAALRLVPKGKVEDEATMNSFARKVRKAKS